jgi:hypothetical protein
VCRFVFWGVANISVRNWSYPDGLGKFEHRGRAMKRLFLVALAGASLELATAVTTPVHAGGSDVAAGLIGGLAAGTIIGAAVAGPRYYAPPPPVYVAPAPYCYWTRGEPVWDGYRGVWTYPSVRVCE